MNTALMEAILQLVIEARRLVTTGTRYLEQQIEATTAALQEYAEMSNPLGNTTEGEPK